MSLLLFVAAAATPDFQPSSCDKPAERAAILATDPQKLPMLETIKARGVENEQKMDQLLTRLAERAKLSDEQKADVAMKMLDSPDFKAAFDDGMALMKKVMKNVEFVMKSKDAAKNCHALVDMMALMPEVDANAQRQWGIMRGIVEAEAKRLNVSLD